MGKSKLAKRKANPNSKYWKDRADAAWAKEIRAVGRCEHCGNDTTLNAHHIIGRTRLRFTHDLSNGICLCSYCHKFDSDFSPHGGLYAVEQFLGWFERERPGQFKWYEENKHDKRKPEWTYKDMWEELT